MNLDLAPTISVACDTCHADIHLGDERCAGCNRSVSRLDRDALRRRWVAADPLAEGYAGETYWGRAALILSALGAALQGVVPMGGFGVGWVIVNVTLAAVFVALFALSWRARRGPRHRRRRARPRLGRWDRRARTRFDGTASSCALSS